MKKILLFVAAALLLVQSADDALAQGEQNVWAFGSKAGINYNVAGGVPVANNLNPSAEGCASICDASGQLLFYSNGCWVWNRYDELMPELTGGVSGYTNPVSPSIGYPPLMPWAGGFVTQPAAICGVPAHPGNYYLFSLGRDGQLCYSVIDMGLNSGKGGIVTGKKSIPVGGGLMGKMTVVKGCNNIWLIVRAKSANQYKSYEINDTGIVLSPVISNVGSLPLSWYTYGVIKFSTDGTQMVAACNQSDNTGYNKYRGGLELYDFDAKSGTLSNARLLDSSSTNGYYYGACFSPDDSKLYASTSSFTNGNAFNYGKVCQFNLSLGSLPSIVASKTVVFADNVLLENNMGDLKRGIDGKVYFGSGQPHGTAVPFMHRIDFPNASGTACGVIPNAIALATSMWSYRGLPNDVALWVAPDTLHVAKQVSVCFRDSVLLVADTGKWYHWQDGSSKRQCSALSNGNYVVGFVNASCLYEVDTFKVNFIHLPVVSAAGYSCPKSRQGTAWVKPNAADTATFTFKWKDASGKLVQQHSGHRTDTIRGLDTGFYSVQVITPSGCDTTLPVSVLALPLPEGSFTVDSIVCRNVPLAFTAHTTAPLWQWFFGDFTHSKEANPLHEYSQTGEYTASLVLTNIEGCTDTIRKKVSVKGFDLKLSANKSLVERGDLVNLVSFSNEAYAVTAWLPGKYFSDQTAFEQMAIADTDRVYVVVGHSLQYGCEDKAEVSVAVNPTVFMPTAFSPNGDGKNDFFHPVSTGGILVRYFEVYNRYGQQVFNGNSLTSVQGWDGTFHGVPCDMGTYYYQINIETRNAETVALKGDVLLVR